MRISIDSATAILYALRIVKFPFEVKAHTNLSYGMRTLKGMLRMDWTSVEMNTFLTDWSCHAIVSKSISKLTNDWSGKVFGLVSTLKVDYPFSHLSVQISIDAP